MAVTTNRESKLLTEQNFQYCYHFLSHKVVQVKWCMANVYKKYCSEKQSFFIRKEQRCCKPVWCSADPERQQAWM